MKLHLGEEGTEQFTITTRANGEVIGKQKIHDPFLHSRTFLKGWKWAWSALFTGIKVEISVSGTEGIQRAIMMLDPAELEKETEEILAVRKQNREFMHGDNKTSSCYTTDGN